MFSATVKKVIWTLRKHKRVEMEAEQQYRQKNMFSSERNNRMGLSTAQPESPSKQGVFTLYASNNMWIVWTIGSLQEDETSRSFTSCHEKEPDITDPYTEIDQGISFVKSWSHARLLLTAYYTTVVNVWYNLTRGGVRIILRCYYYTNCSWFLFSLTVVYEVLRDFAKHK